MSDARKKKYLVIGAGPVGTKIVLGLKEKFKEHAVIELVEKRLEPGNRQEVLLLNKDSFSKLPEDVHHYLFDPDNEGMVKAFRSKSVYHGKYKQLVPEEHTIVKINDLEHALCNAVANRNIPIHRGFEFMTANQGKAQFKNIETNAIIEKEYDELVLAIGLSGTLSHSHLEEPIFETPRLLHSFPVMIARFAADFRDYQPEQPTSILCFTQDRLAFFFITPDSFSTCISAPNTHINKLSSLEEQIQFVRESAQLIPQELQSLLERTNLSRPLIIKQVPAVATLTPKLLDAKQHMYIVGDATSTFPYVWGSETNVAYNKLLPLLENLFEKLAECSLEERHQHLQQYESDVKQAIITNDYFLRLSPYGETIHLGKIDEKDGKQFYSFPGWDELAKAEPYSKESKHELMPLHALNQTSLVVQTAAHSNLVPFTHPSDKPQRSIFAAVTDKTAHAATPNLASISQEENKEITRNTQ